MALKTHFGILYNNKQDLKKLLQSLNGEGEKYKALIYFILSTGAREGEAAGLHWKDIDLTNGFAVIEQAAIRIKGGSTVIKVPKNGRVRTLKLPDFSVQAIKELQVIRYSMNVNDNYQINPTDYFFSSDTY